MHSGLWLSRALSTRWHPTLSLIGSTLTGRSPFPELTVTCDTDAERATSLAKRPGRGRAADGSGCVRAAHPSRIPGTAIPGEDCDFLQMTEVPPASSVGERSPRRESTFSISPPSPAHCRKCHDWRLFRVDQPRPATLLSPQPAPTSTDAPKSPLRGCRLMPYRPRIVANRDTSQQKRQACADVAAFTSPATWHA